MNCYASGIVGLGMLGATFATMTVSEEQHDVLRKVLSPELDAIHSKIVAERRNLYMQGLLLGLIASYASLRLVPTRNLFHRITFVLAITILTSVLYYSLMPKSDYMLNHLKTAEENKAWLSVYKTMKHRYFLGMVLGSLAAVPIAYAMCQ
jgi:hypothetical protein